MVRRCATQAWVFFGIMVWAIVDDRGWSQEQFVLDVPGNAALQSTAIVRAGGLTIVDADGNRFLYVRRPEHDSRDREYLGYYSAEARKFLRWPVAGAGAMYLGSRDGDGVAWQRSRMQVSRVGQPGERLVVRRPAAPDDPALGRLDDRLLANERPQLAVLVEADRTVVAHVDREGVLHFYEGRDDGWQHLDSGLRERLPPGAPLALLESEGELPVAVGVDAGGRLVAIRSGRLRVLTAEDAPRFQAGSHLAALQRGTTTTLVLVDDRGRVWSFDPMDRAWTAIESRPGIFEPGIPVAGVTGDAADDLFLIDRRGQLLHYRRTAERWSRPQLVATGLVSGGGVAAAYAADRVPRTTALTVSAVDVAGRLHVWTAGDAGWGDDVRRDLRLAPGSAVTLASISDRLVVSAVPPDGRWIEWERRQGDWSVRPISDGFLAGSSVLLLGHSRQAFGLDRTGRLVVGHLARGGWQNVIVAPGLSFAPRLVNRAVVPNPALPPAAVDFQNTGREELVVRLLSTNAQQRAVEFLVPPGGSVQQSLDRDAGATLEETYLVPGPAGDWVEEVHRHPLRPQSLYNAVVYANRVTSVYFDRTKNKSATPDEVNSSLVSLGVFVLPPGEQVQDGARIDVFREASARRNPGAAALVDPPAP